MESKNSVERERYEIVMGYYDERYDGITLCNEKFISHSTKVGGTSFEENSVFWLAVVWI